MTTTTKAINMIAVERLGQQEVDQAGAEQKQHHGLADHIPGLPARDCAVSAVGSSFGPSAASRRAASCAVSPAAAGSA